MPFSDKDKVLIKYFRMENKYSARELLSEFIGKEWSRSGLDKLLRKIDKTGSIVRKKGSPKSACTEGNIEIVDEFVQSQEGEEPRSHVTISTVNYRIITFKLVSNQLLRKQITNDKI